ncbi:SSH4 family protein [Sporobolomyces koalae]|uniref:SSH4 family protein n=1 Tax=Sporobolomyces koalae TaxID=500713 RepID=UPI00317073B9
MDADTATASPRLSGIRPIVAAFASSSRGAPSPVEQIRQYISEIDALRSYEDGSDIPQWPYPNDPPRYPPVHDGDGDGGGSLPTLYPDPRRENDATLAILIPLIIVLSTLLFLIFLLIILLLKRRRGIQLLEEGGPTNLEREDLVDAEGGFEGVESRWMQDVEEPVKVGYLRAKDWQTQYPPNSQPTEITLSQFLSIQEKGVSAWSFEPDYESNPALIVQSRTEITFLADGFGMAPEEGGGCCVQSNLPLPKLNEVYYWEAKMFEKPEATNISIGLATKPYPSFRLPGWNRFSIGYHSSDGFKSHNFPFTATSYGPPLLEGDTLGVGYRPRSGTVFFTRNGKKLDDAFIGFNKHNLFPTVGADGACSIHVNLGQAGFVFIEANVKKWGLAPMMGTLAPPPAYGSERGSILLESAAVNGTASTSSNLLGEPTTSIPTRRPPPSSSASSSRLLPTSPPATRGNRRRRHERPAASHSATPAGAASALGASPSQPIRPSPLRHSRHASNLSNASSSAPISENGSNSPAREAGDGTGVEEEEDEDVHNPPTPGLLDISLHSIHRFPNRVDESDEDEERDAGHDDDDDEDDSENEIDAEQTLEQRLLREVARERRETASTRSISPPAYNPIDPHMYAPGVAETILEDALTNPSHHHQTARSSGTAAPSSTSAESRANYFLAQLGLAPRQTGPAGASGSSTPSSVGGTRYEGRTGRGGVGNWTAVQSGSSGANGNSWFGWLAGNNQAQT